ncbi:GH25 family lysozyme [Kocuria sp. SM24M-10]|uniref:GH25 family lysozyme n=1 Tax=Kocuria sp. SM24M-10 TaxID=1660349 RepID=UPI001EF08DCA|nr:GH25 family lysozyme [Kocuria sp. SM24M-10]
MKAPPRLTLPAALTAAVLAITTLTPTAATEDAAPTTLSAEQQGNLVSEVVESDGAIVSTLKDVDTGQVADGTAISGSSLGESFKDSEGRAAASGLGSVAAYTTWRPSGIQGLDVSSNQSVVNWTEDYRAGARFAYIKATESADGYNTKGQPVRGYKSPTFAAQYKGAYESGMIRGAYHFAHPDDAPGAVQADYFINNGGGWSADGRTLPGMVDLEATAGQDYCYNLTPAQMVAWIRDFSNRYKARTGRVPAIYTGAYWWNQCTGNSTAFNDHPLHLPAYDISAPNKYPAGWTRYDIWQYSETGPFLRATGGGDSNVFGGTSAQLADLAKNRYYKPLGGRAPAGTVTEVQPAGYTLKGAIGRTYHALGGSAVFGTPTGNERGGLMGGGVLQGFSKNHTFYWSPATGAQPVNFNGAIGRKFAAHRWENGLGYPTTREITGLTGGGAYQVFRHGTAVNKLLWTQTTGAHLVRENTGIGGAWKRGGFERGYGYPVTDEISGLVNGGAHQVFRNGSAVYRILWSPTTGAHWLKENSAIGREWIAAGAERGYGYPTTGEYRYGTEVRQRFSNNWTVHYSTVTKRIWVTR